MRTLYFLFLLLVGISVNGQVVISQNPLALPSASSMLDMDGSMLDGTKRGLLIPRMTDVQRKAIGSPAEGLWVYQTNLNPGYYIFSGNQWVRVAKDRTLPGKVVFDDVTSAVSVAGGYTGYTVAGTATPGEFNVTFATPFSTPPTVLLTAEAVPPIATISDPEADYCYPTHTQNCTTFLNADYLNTVVIQSCPGGSCVTPTPTGPTSFNNANTGCNNTANNYVNYFFTHQATLDAGPGSFFNLSLSSGPEWRDNLFAWIDWNQDGDFADSQEVVFEHYFPASTPTTNNPAFAALITEPSLQVPAFANNGTTVLRAMSRFVSTVPNPCGSQLYGETQDYKIIITGTTIPSVAEPRASNCNVSSVTTTNFKVNCFVLSSGAKLGTSFDFYATEH